MRWKHFHQDTTARFWLIYLWLWINNQPSWDGCVLHALKKCKCLHKNPSLCFFFHLPRQATCHLAQTSSSLMKRPMCFNVGSPWATPEQYIFFGSSFQRAMKPLLQWAVSSVSPHAWTDQFTLHCLIWRRGLYRFILASRQNKRDTFWLEILVFLQSHWSFYVNNVHL